jgi:hypothetical protein
MSQILISRDRAAVSLQSQTLTAALGRLLDHAVAAASDAVRKFCRRDFIVQQYDEQYDGPSANIMVLRNYPIISVERVATSLNEVLRIINNSASNQRATVQVTSEGLTLIRTASGVQSIDTSVTWSANATLAAVATAINALGNGWSAEAVTAHQLLPSRDLRPIQGALGCMNKTANLKLHTEELGDYGIDANKGYIISEKWATGLRNYRIIYTAGFESVPESVQEATAEWAAALYYQAMRDPGLTQQQIPGNVSRTSGLTIHGIPDHIQRLLAPYINHRA